MARRRRRRRAATTHRRRRRRSVTLSINRPRRRRVRRHHSNPRRRYRRNPGMGGGIVSTIKQGVKDGAMVLVGEVAQGRASALAGKFVPVGGIAGEAITGIGSAVIVTIAARKFLPGGARFIAAGAFANAVRRLVSAVSPTAASLLGDGEVIGGMPVGALYSAGNVLDDGMGAYPGGGLGAYPGGGLGDEEMATYIS
jgi:hypothetical protein